MAADAALDKDEQALFNQMRDDKPVDDGSQAAAAKAAEEAASKEAAEKAAAAKEVADKSKPEEKMLPAAAVAEARKENKELKKELEAMKTLVSEGDKKLQKFIDTVSKKAEDSGPSLEENPAGHLKHENEQLKKAMAEINEKLARQDAAAQQGNKLQEFAATVTAHEKAFAKDNPDYYKASEYVAAMWKDEFEEAGYKPEDIPKMVFNKALAITHQAVQSERDPAGAIYKIAARYGFKKPAPPEEKKPDGESKLKAIEKGLDAAKSGGGGNGPDEITLTTLASMSDAEIEKAVADKDWWAKNIKRSALH